MIKVTTYYRINSFPKAETSWDNYKQIKNWAKDMKHELIERKNLLIIILENEVLIYDKKREGSSK